MNPRSKFSVSTRALVVGTMVSMLVPSAVFAQTPPTAPRDARANFCTRIEEVTTKVTTQLADREAKYESRRTENRGKMSERFGERDLTRTEKRSN